MKTHTIRWNSNKTIRIIKFTPDFLALLLKSEDLAIGMFLETLKKSCKQATGNDHSFDYEQITALSKYGESIRVPYEKKGYFYSRVMEYFLDGVQSRPMIEPIDLLNICNYACRNLKMDGTNE